MKTLRKYIINENGWRHILGFLAVGYIILFVGNTDLFTYSKVFPFSMLRSFYEQNLILKLIVLAIPTIVFSFEIEARQKNRFGVKISIPDIICSVVGIWLSIPLEQHFHSTIILIIAVLGMSAAIGFVILQLQGKD